MKLDKKDILFLIKRKIFSKRNIILVSILILMFIIIFTCLTIAYLSIDFNKVTYNSSTARELLVNSVNDKESDYKVLNDIEHIEFSVSSKFLSFLINAKPLVKSNLENYILFKPLLSQDDIKIIDGKNIENSKEVICPNNFYPYDLYIDENLSIKKIYYDKFLDGKDFIGKSIAVSSNLGEEEKNFIADFKIVGVYDNKDTNNEGAVCYISMNDFDRMQSNIIGISHTVWTDGHETDEKEYYQGKLVRVDNYKNMEEVINKLQNMGFSVTKVVTMDEGLMNLMFYIPLFIVLIILLITFNIIYNFLKKKSEYYAKNIGILKANGYKEKELLKINKLENIIIMFISLIISLNIYLAIFILIKHFFYELVYYNYSLKIPVVYILGISIILIISINIISEFIFKKTINKDVIELIEESN